MKGSFALKNLAKDDYLYKAFCYVGITFSVIGIPTGIMSSFGSFVTWWVL